MNTREEYQDLFGIYWPIGVAVFLGVAAVVLFAVLRYRSDADEFREAKSKSHAEELYAVGLVVVAAALVFFTFSTMADLEEPPAAGEPGLRIQVTAAQWSWRFEYPEFGITQLAGSVGSDPLVVPTDTPIRFTLTSIDVQHAFYVPELRFKRDAFPGGTTAFTLIWDRPGTSPGHCAEFCGLLHSEHKFEVEALPPDEFEAWAEQEAADQRARSSTSLALPGGSAG